MNDEVRLIQPPHSIEAEQSLLGALLISNQAFEDVSWLGASAFYQDNHRRIWSAICRLIEMGKAADIVTLCEELKKHGDLDKAGGAAYIAGLAQNTPSALNLRRYADIVAAKAVQRKLMQVGNEIAESALSPGVREPEQLLDEAETKIFGLSENTHRGKAGPKGIASLLSKVYERIDHLHNQDNQSDVIGVPTGFADLDVKTAGLQPGDLVIVAGRPSMGKTAFALNIAEHVAVKVQLPVAIFSMEMSGTQLSQRLLSSIAKVDAQRLRTGRLNDDEWADLTSGMSVLHEARIEIDDSAALTGLEVRSRARRLKRQYGKLGLVVIDYLQLMAATGQGENRATEISEISRSLKAMAKELDVPVILLSQLNREVDKRHGRRPMMSDLRESGAIEQDADTILFLYREEVYEPDCEEHLKGVAEVIIGKQRNGPIGKVLLTFLGRYTRFTNHAPADYVAPSAPKARVRNFNDFKKAAGGPDA
jgi:replicative DNA helicase